MALRVHSRTRALNAAIQHGKDLGVSEQKRQNEEEEEDDDDDDSDESPEIAPTQGPPIAKGTGKGKASAPPGLPPPPENAPQTLPEPSTNEPLPSPPSLPPVLPPPPPSTSQLSLSTTFPLSSTTTSGVVTSVQTSFITITQSAKGKGEGSPPSTTESSSRSAVATLSPLTVLATTTSRPVGVTQASPVDSASISSTIIQASTSALPSQSNELIQSQAVDHSISRGATNLLIALGAIGGLSLFVAAGMILLRWRKGRVMRDHSSAVTDTKSFSAHQPKLGVTTYITALPPGDKSFVGIETSPNGRIKPLPSARPTARGTHDNMKKPQAMARDKGERSFSGALDAFFAKARRSSYEYKIGP